MKTRLLQLMCLYLLFFDNQCIAQGLIINDDTFKWIETLPREYWPFQGLLYLLKIKSDKTEQIPVRIPVVKFN